jgi:hypothetical protein
MPFSHWPVLDRVLVNLVDGSAIDGLLIEKRGPLLVLADAQLLTAASEPTRMDGQVFVERTQILFIQSRLPKGG